ncbi:MAG: YceI family protein [Rhizobacter sp.]|nr:YceI family protein [Rhizobacter sp.]
MQTNRRAWVRRVVALALGAAAATALTQTQQRLLPAQSEITFTSRQMGVPVTGRFRDFDADIAFDPRRPEAAQIRIDIDLASVTLASSEVEAELATPGWFDSRRTPRARFASSAVKPLGGGRFEITGRLTIKNVTREIVVPVTLAASGTSTAASGRFVIKRLDFRIGDGDWGDTSLVADEVQVRFRLLLAGVAVP